MNWHVGDVWVQTWRTRDPITEALVDPITVTATTTNPAGVTSSVALSRIEKGVYRVRVPLTEAGDQCAELATTGEYQGVAPRRIRVLP